MLTELDTISISTVEEALAYADEWRSAYLRLERENDRLRRELGMQRTFAEVFGDAWLRLWWER